MQVLLNVLGPSTGGPGPDSDGSGNGNGDGTGNGDGSGNGGNDGGSDASTGQVVSSCSVGNSQQGGLTGLLCIAGRPTARTRSKLLYMPLVSIDETTKPRVVTVACTPATSRG